MPTLGVVPDARPTGAATRRTRWASRTGGAAAQPDAPLQIAVVRLPFISNYTDFDALADEPDVNVRYVTTPAELQGAAAIVLPGTKSTIADLAWLRATRPGGGAGGARRRRHAGRRRLRRLSDARPPHPRPGARGVRRDGGGRPRPARRRDHVRRRQAHRARRGRAAGGPPAPAIGPADGPAGTPLHGYEIHMGRTTLGSGAAPLLRLRGADGSRHDDGAVGRRRGSAAATCTASSTSRRFAPPSSTACVPGRPAVPRQRRAARRTTTSTGSPTTWRRTSTRASSSASSVWRHDDQHGSSLARAPSTSSAPARAIPDCSRATAPTPSRAPTWSSTTASPTTRCSRWRRADAELVYVGKQAAVHAVPQARINELLVGARARRASASCASRAATRSSSAAAARRPRTCASAASRSSSCPA